MQSKGHLKIGLSGKVDIKTSSTSVLADVHGFSDRNSGSNNSEAIKLISKEVHDLTSDERKQLKVAILTLYNAEV